jgi:hypothetical protein
MSWKDYEPVIPRQRTPRLKFWGIVVPAFLASVWIGYRLASLLGP